MDVTRPDKPSKRTAKKATADEQKRFVVDVTRPDKPSKRAAKKVATDEQQAALANKARKLNKKFLNQHRNDRLADGDRLEVNNEAKAQNGDFIKIGDTSYRKSRIFTEVTCEAEAIIRSVEEKHIIRVQNAPYDRNIIDMFDFRNLDKEQSYHISQAEKLARYKELEYIFFYDDSGKVLFGAIGTRRFLAVSKLGLGKEELAGLNCLHNHPSGYIAFSFEDMDSFVVNKPKEAKLITRDGILSFRPEYTMLTSEDSAAKIFDDINKGTEKKLRKKYPKLYEDGLSYDEQISNAKTLAHHRQLEKIRESINTFRVYGIIDLRTFDDD